MQLGKGGKKDKNCVDIKFTKKTFKLFIEVLIRFLALLIRLLVICALLKYCSAEHFCKPKFDPNEVKSHFQNYKMAVQNVKYLKIETAPRLGNKIAKTTNKAK